MLPLVLLLVFRSGQLQADKPSVSFTSNVADTAVNEFSSHERVIPLFYNQGSPIDSTCLHGEHLKDITIVIPSARKNFTLDLTINQDLLSSKYVKRRPHSNGYHIHKPSDISLHKKGHCYYHGHIRGFPHSMAAVSTCEGISGFWSDELEFFHLEPSPDKGQFVHLMYRDSDRIPMNYSCGYHQKHDLSPGEQTRRIMKRVKRDVHGPYDSNDHTRYVELFLVNDYRLAQARSVVELEHRSKEITNIVSRMYRALNIYVALVGMEVWDQADQVTITADSSTTLDNFLRYRRERINPIYPNDNAQLLTGVRFEDGKVGKAVRGPICTFQYSGAVNMDYSSLVSSVASTVAHMMGHNLGMQHDTESCKCPQDRCIMAAIDGSASSTMWSSCSKQAVVDAFRQGMDYCLRNKPKQLFGASMCGNGFLEKGEDCDCGLPEACDNKCCNAMTCRLTPSALCATGKCCNRSTCRPLPEATVCREAKGTCDLAEYCNGTTEFCPDDVSVQNGHPCKDGAAYCYDGKCSTHTDQCQLLWGPSGKKSDDLCYRKLNTEGGNIGNCGFDWIRSTYAKCKPQDVLCGMLHCVHLNEKLMFWKDAYAYSLPATFIQTTNRNYVCRGAVLDVGLNMPDPGMVPNGARCGEAKMCVNQRCISLPSSGSGQTCSSRCNNHGVCNSKGSCHCDAGFAPPLCAVSGYGCSVDSGPCRFGVDATTTTTVATTTTTQPGNTTKRSDVQCGSEFITVEIPMNLLPGIGRYSLQDPTCLLTTQGGKLRAEFGHTECGTVARFTDDAIVYKNSLYIEKTNESIPIVCEYPRRKSLSISYKPVQRNVRFYEKNFGVLDITMRQYSSDSFSNEIHHTSYPVSVKPDEPVYIKVEASSLAVFPGSCLATSSQTPHDATMSRELIKNGCKTDPSVVIYPSTDGKLRFSFNAFSFAPQIPVVYVHCEVLLCDASDLASECHQGCTGTVSRTKRSLVTAAREGHFVSGGPLVVDDKRSITDSSLDAILVAVATVSMIVAVVSVMVAVITLQMKQTNTPNSTTD